MSRARVVLGALFGDEGKGRMVDALSSPASWVVRHNGGAQAGHTVVSGGRRHVFSHVGSGTFRGAATWLSPFFAVHPILFLREQAALAAHGVRPRVRVAPEAPVTTPAEMMLNQWAEEDRGAARHGSCGVGFGETVARQEAGPRLSAGDLPAPGLADRLEEIFGGWAPRRAEALGIRLDARRRALLSSEDLRRRWLADVGAFLDGVEIGDPPPGAEIVFEGAQGLLLDQDGRFFPHVTRSSTGLRNVLALMPRLGVSALSVVYAVRGYATRHGAGPFPAPQAPSETAPAWLPRFQDETNRPNPWQGVLRIAPLSLPLLAEAIRGDLALASGVPVEAGLAVGCLDQADRLPVGAGPDGAGVSWLSPEAAAQAAASAAGLRLGWRGWGPEASDLEAVRAKAA